MKSDSYAEILEKIEDTKNKCVIVEGINDKKSLEKLGFTNIFIINRLPMYKVVDLLHNKTEIVLLVDLDCEGRKIYSELKEQFLKTGVAVDDALRELLFKTALRQIEGLANYLERNEHQHSDKFKNSNNLTYNR